MTNSKINKVQRYDWTEILGKPGHMRMIRLADLHVDHSYQRPEVTDGSVLAIARDFTWEAAQVCTVMERSNGTLWVVDGQQRVLALQRRGDVTVVPCIVYKSNGPEHEARIFKMINERRRSVPAIVRFRAADRAGVQPERDVADWLRSRGLQIDKTHGRTDTAICFPDVLVRTWKVDMESAKRALDFQRQISNGSPCSGIAHKGLWFLLRAGIRMEDERDRLGAAGGLPAVLREIRSLEIELSQKHNDRLCGIAIVRLLNKRRRTRKLVLPAD